MVLSMSGVHYLQRRAFAGWASCFKNHTLFIQGMWKYLATATVWSVMNRMPQLCDIVQDASQLQAFLIVCVQPVLVMMKCRGYCRESVVIDDLKAGYLAVPYVLSYIDSFLVLVCLCSGVIHCL
eukprot:TRINITY_DN1586_c0_g2_i1.p5 TRINITY_DN1586_c0_g2~~TRINITY_DN1586_c0_g2_i1.p5  ORF type:complete len:124 (+),score=2.80 TRINITY_DN1586_c0_g2_i1:343-714(+)